MRGRLRFALGEQLVGNHPTAQDLLTMSLGQLAHKYQMPRSTLFDYRQRAQRAGLGLPSQPATTPIAASIAAENPDDFLQQVSTFSKSLNAQHSQTEFVDVAAGSKPIALAFTGDWHFGSVGTDYDALYADLRKLEESKGLYVVGMGDYGDNYKANMGSAASGLYDAVVASPDDQQKGWYRLLERLQPKLLALILGCHLSWDFQKVGKDALQPVCEKLGTNSLGAPIANMGYGGVLRVTVGDQKYTCLARHRVYSGDGGGNPSNAQRKMERDYPIDTEWDIIALAHKHFNDLHLPSVRGRPQVWLRSGSYKVRDRFGQQLNGYVGEPGIPIVILRPDRHEMLAFRGDQLDTALKALDLVRKGYL